MATDPLPIVSSLVDRWCERRELGVLGLVLRGYPLSGAQTDSWGDLLDALKDVRAKYRDDLPSDEAKMLQDAISTTDALIQLRLRDVP